LYDITHLGFHILNHIPQIPYILLHKLNLILPCRLIDLFRRQSDIETSSPFLHLGDVRFAAGDCFLVVDNSEITSLFVRTAIDTFNSGFPWRCINAL
jgi:hypothetical protein